VARDSEVSGVRRRWTAAWLGAMLIGVANGAAREATYSKRVGERTANNISGVTLVAALGAYFRLLQARWPIGSDRDALVIGARWSALTVVFEFTFGRLVDKQSWDEMLAQYDVTEGQTWPLVLTWIGVGPAVVRRLAGRRP
jgi:hypothetical protein